MPKQVAWTPHEDQILRDGWLRGESSCEIHTRLPNRTYWAVFARRPLLDLPPRRDQKPDGSYNYRPRTVRA